MAEIQPMTEAMYYILLSLEKPVHGYGMMQRIRELSRGRVNMGPGTLYGVLGRMKGDGWIEQIESGEDSRRKTYLLTSSGRQALTEEYHRLQMMVEDGAFIEAADEADTRENPERIDAAGLTDSEGIGDSRDGADHQGIADRQGIADHQRIADSGDTAKSKPRDRRGKGTLRLGEIGV